MPAFQSEASVEIDANIETVRAVLTDFHSWPIWSPWLYVEPEAKVTYHGTTGELGAGNSWVGDKTGEGKITLTGNKPSRLDLDLEFIKPFKSHADVSFDLTALSDNKTQVRWGMDSSLPFFMFWMKNTMVGMINSDYRRGLQLLKDHIETGNIPSSATFDGIVELKAMPYVGIHGECAMEDLGDAMTQQFTSLGEATADMDPTEIFTICNRLDIKADRMDYTAAVAVGDRVAVDAPFVTGRRAACRALKVTHVGPYRHLGSGWFMAISEQRHGKYKLVSTAPAFEVYRSTPADTPENELVTEIYIPIR